MPCLVITFDVFIGSKIMFMFLHYRVMLPSWRSTKATCKVFDFIGNVAKATVRVMVINNNFGQHPRVGPSGQYSEFRTMRFQVSSNPSGSKAAR